MLIKPEQWDLLGPSILVKRYEKPTQIDSILLPPDYRFDSSWTLWEVVKTCEKADDFIGYALKVDDILTTLRRIPTNVGIDKGGAELFVMGLDSDLIRSILRWKKKN